ncbi:CAP Gly-rich domain-containing protein [Chlamydoabsidia padenii]|nr:CAP Gly-rich domain-containing protein [Chlamydoabsidia padenii]
MRATYFLKHTFLTPHFFFVSPISFLFLFFPKSILKYLIPSPFYSYLTLSLFYILVSFNYHNEILFMSKLPKAPLEFNLSRKRNHQPISTKSTTITTQLNTIDDGLNLGMNETEDPQVGDRVLVEGKQLYGTLRYLGPTEFKPGKWAGVELDHQGTGKNDGSVQG